MYLKRNSDIKKILRILSILFFGAIMTYTWMIVFDIGLDNKKLVYAAILISVFWGINLALYFKQEKKTMIFTKKAFVDKLTGAYNREYLDFYFTKNKTSDFIFIIMDIDHFKSVNDTYGHNTGDIVLQRVAALILRLIRHDSSDRFIRLGGEEFLLILKKDDVKNKESLLNIVERMRRNINEQIFEAENGKEFSITMSFGVNSIANEENYVEAINCADQALYEAKLERNKIVFYDERMIDEKNLDIDKVILLIKRGKMVLLVQPILNLKTGDIQKYETLMRLEDEKLTYLPKTFLKLIKNEKEKILMLETILQYNKKIMDADKKNIYTMNMSSQEILNEKILEKLIEFISLNQEYIGRLWIEVKDEDVKNISLFRENLTILKNVGFKLILDDYGKYSSSILLTCMDIIDEIKMSSEITKGIFSEKKNTKEYIKSVLIFAENNGISVIASHIENRKTEEFLIKIGVHYGQGFYLGKPKKFK